jgi:hypothetical protein
MSPPKIVTAPTLQNIQAPMKLLVSDCYVFVIDDDVIMGIMTAPTISTYEIYANFGEGKGIFLNRGTIMYPMPNISIVMKPSNCTDLCNLIMSISAGGKATPYSVIIHKAPKTEPNNNMITDVITNGLLGFCT